ncbi:hypothetical protein CBR_g30225 [Chara braunii]|uniref:Uncharacterized protein n=1 Tax=Chara braunii TaxID=69332 RepID=A0A388LCN7_CHABU|nr:hypothetical protein CBR_g30225 [Chara braunii]|eukprot:GBG79963.1 hypothetical protein CBR_g30225 [Chara braunii]
MMLRGDVKQTTQILRRNLKHIRTWLEEEQALSSGHRSAVSEKLKEIEGSMKNGAKLGEKAPEAKPKE